MRVCVCVRAGGGANSISHGMYILLLLSHETLGERLCTLNELKLEVVFPSPELTPLQELKLKTGGKVHFAGGALGEC